MTTHHIPVRDLLQVPQGKALDLTAIDPRSTPGVTHRKTAKRGLAALEARLADLQERLWAEGAGGGRRRLLVVLQGMDSSGKDGVVRHVVGAMNPAGVDVTSFGPPTTAELRHDFLWRVRGAVPTPGRVGVFNRSHYEDVLVARVHDLVPPDVWEQRYDLINEFEADLVADGVTIVKVMLHISPDEQRDRLLRRLDRADKRWKFAGSDVVERGFWDDYQRAYEAALMRCTSPMTPWYVVPADRRWYRSWAVANLLVETLEQLDPQYPQPDLDIPALRERLLASGP